MSGLAKVPTSVLTYVTDCARRLQQNPGDPDGLFARALIFAALGRPTQARESVQLLARVAPRHPAVLQVRIHGSLDLDALEGVSDTVLRYVNACAQRLDRNPKDADALFTRAAILATLGQHDDALRSLETLAKVAPQYPAVWRLKARLYKELGDLKTAELCVRAAERFEAEQEGKEPPSRPREKVSAEDAAKVRRLILDEGE